jgi:hypothetical protein
MKDIKNSIWLILILICFCKPSFIPNTEILATSENKEIIRFCEKYRRAVERKDIAAILALVSPRYYEDGGTPTGEDDYGYKELKEKLYQNFKKIKTIRYEIKYRKIIKHNSRIFVEYTWRGSYQLSTSSGNRWYRKVEDNRLELERVGRSFRIISGL